MKKIYKTPHTEQIILSSTALLQNASLGIEGETGNRDDLLSRRRGGWADDDE